MQVESAKQPQVKRNSLWPNVETPDGAAWAVKQAFWAAIIVAVVTAIFAAAEMMGLEFVRRLGIDRWALLDATIFGCIAWGLSRHSRFAAWTGLLLFTVGRIYLIAATGSPSGIIVSAVIIMALLGGVRGAHALHRMKSEAPHEAEQRLAA